MSESPPRREVQLDPQLQARLLEQMREEQAAAMRRHTVLTWVLLLIALAALAIGTALSFSDDIEIAIVANLVATAIGWVLWRIHKPRIKRWFGFE